MVVSRSLYLLEFSQIYFTSTILQLLLFGIHEMVKKKMNCGLQTFLQVDELQNTIEEEQRSLVEEMRMAIEEHKTGVDDAGAAPEAMLVD